MLDQFLVNDAKAADYKTLNDNLLFIDYINAKYNYKVIAVQPDIAYRYQGNFYGLMRVLNISVNLYLYTMYLNGINNPTDYDGLKLQLTIPIKPPIPTN